MSLQSAADVPLLISSPNSSSERRISPSWTIAQLKGRLEPITGVPAGSQQLSLRVGSQDAVALTAPDEEQTRLAAFPLQPYAEITVRASSAFSLNSRCSPVLDQVYCAVLSRAATSLQPRLASLLPCIYSTPKLSSFMRHTLFHAHSLSGPTLTLPTRVTSRLHICMPRTAPRELCTPVFTSCTALAARSARKPSPSFHLKLPDPLQAPSLVWYSALNTDDINFHHA
jgi:hypothetical protein